MLAFSVVIPVYNEESSLRPLYFSLKKVLDSLAQPYEIIFVNDGSQDRSLEELKSIEPVNLVIINLNRHSGKSAALQAGFDFAQGKLIITMDGDLQNDPPDIPKLLEKMKEGYDVVCGFRYERKDPQGKLLAAGIANALRRIIGRENIHDVGCAFRVFKKEVLQSIYLSGGLHRFFTLIVLKLGYKVGEVKVQHYPRKFGKTKYNTLNRAYEGAIDLIRICLGDTHNLMPRKAIYQIHEIIRK